MAGQDVGIVRGLNVRKRRPKVKNISRDEGLKVLRRVFSENGRQHIRGYVFAGICLVTVALSTSYVAYIMKTFIDRAFSGQNAESVWLICFSIFVAFSLRGFASYGQAIALSRVSNNIIASYQRRVSAHLMKLSVEFFNTRRSAQVVAQINQNISGVRDVLNITITSTSRDLLSLVSLVGVMFYQDFMLATIALIFAPPMLFGLRHLSLQLRAATAEGVKISGRVFGSFQETIQGISIVKAFTMEDQLSNKLDEVIVAAENRSNQIVRLSERNGPMVETFAGAAVACVIGYAAYRTIYLNVPPGAFFSFITALLMAYDPARRLTKIQVQMQRAATNAKLLYTLLDSEPNQPDAPSATKLKVPVGRVEFRSVSFGYGEQLVLNNVAFTAEGGQTTALVGPSGAGKSTLASLLLRFFDPAEGCIAIDDQDIASVTKRSLREKIAYVSQQPYLFEGSIGENIRLGRPGATQAEIEEAARLAFAHDFILQQPMGYDTPLGENGITLSGGQRQRLSIARAILRNAPILLLDEATSALDTESEATVQQALDAAMVGRTVIVIAHRFSTIRNADKIVVMHGGNVVEEGTHASLSQVPGGLYSRLNELHNFSA
ncbi:ABC transporter ATP-binding protein [Rhizobium sp. AC44/96]|jgi:ATP-binding cassette subfamily B protein|uniref:ABC transporter ATP-binding protein n=1 Tax=Rhizobium sp. AC44/96 TaxID=1841654 RepID=UPI00080F8CDE|nr:ABC transporter ATP-binding protein [Rhizobium sp. AC44/96]OCJ10230.1 ABC transporter ATP-binding protein [Rhizobium sp. AC44/96]